MLERRKHKEEGKFPGKVLEPHLSHVRETPLLNREGTTKGHFCSFAEKGRGLDPQDPSPSCVPVKYETGSQIFYHVVPPGQFCHP